MISIRPTDPDDGFGRQLTTLPGWREFVASSASESIARLTQDDYDAFDKEDQHAYDDDRLTHHARLQVVATSTVRRVVTCGRRLIILNRGAVSARRGLMVTGPANTGKTIALTQLGLSHELQDRRRRPGQNGRIPVIYITVPPAATARMIAAEFARFLGLPVMGRANITDLTEAVVGVCTQAGTGLVLVDEIHNIALDTRIGAEASDTLKCFSERIPATFAYAGIDVEEILSGTRGDQIAARFTPIVTHPLPYKSEWRALVAEMERNLLLQKHQQGTLTRLDRLLHTPSGGMIGTLSHLVRGAAVDAILTGAEKITRAGLLAVELDIAANRKSPGNRPVPDGAQ